MTSEEIEQTMRHHLERLLPVHSAREVYQYATLPGGKLFRPHLVWSVLSDLNPTLYKNSSQNRNAPHSLLASSVEFHHSYTLIHDDLPCMDDDTTRRGKACTHLVYGEWQALLAGDGLLNLSYQLLTKSSHPRTLEVMKFFSWALGPKGLIHGQVLDLSEEMTKSFENTLRTHELKTARLIQVAILCSALFSQSKNTIVEKKLWKYSKRMGINFQLIDDLSELAESELSEHEKLVNPWLHHPEKSYHETVNGLKEFEQLSRDLKLHNTNKIVSEYYAKMLTVIETSKSTIEKHLKNKNEILPIILLMKNFGQR